VARFVPYHHAKAEHLLFSEYTRDNPQTGVAARTPHYFRCNKLQISLNYFVMNKKLVCITSKRKTGIVYQFPKPEPPPKRAA
jgi:hypothetical protein